MRNLYLMALSVGLLTACSGNTGNTNTAGNLNSAPAANSNASAAGYPQETRDAFLRSCESAGSEREFCTCVLEKVQAKYSIEEFAAIEEQIQAGEPSDEFIAFSTKAREECEKQTN